MREAEFLAVHSLEVVQAVCVIVPVAHGLGESDRVATMLSVATRIAQSLDLNRLGPEGQHKPGSSPPADAEILLREVKKRAWWFLVRGDWMQIPYDNLFTINILHFNTPPPLNCYEDLDLMVKDGMVQHRDWNIYTQSSWTAIHNQCRCRCPTNVHTLDAPGVNPSRISRHPGVQDP